MKPTKKKPAPVWIVTVQSKRGCALSWGFPTRRDAEAFQGSVLTRKDVACASNPYKCRG